MQSVGLSDELSVYLSAPLLPLDTLQSTAAPRRLPPEAADRSTSIQLRRPETEVDSPFNAAVSPAVVLDQGVPSNPSGSGDRDPMPSSPSNVDARDAGSFSRPSPPIAPPKDDKRSLNPRGTASVDRNPPRFHTSTSGSGSAWIGAPANPAELRRNSSPEMMTSGKPSVEDDAGFVQHPTMAGDVVEGSGRSTAEEGPEERTAVAEPRCCWTRLSISRLARSTLSGDPTTSNTGSVPRDGVTIYVWVSCWIRFTVEPFGPTTNPTDLTGTRTSHVTWPLAPPPEVAAAAGAEVGERAAAVVQVPEAATRRLARIWLKCSAAESISCLAALTSSRRPVMTKTGSSPRAGVLMYVFVLARSALILQPTHTKPQHQHIQS